MSAHATDTPVRYVNSSGLEAVIARIVQQAISDHLAGRHCPGHPSATAFLVSMGICDPATGVIDWCGHRRMPRRPLTRKDTP